MMDDDIASSLVNIAQSLDAAFEEKEGFRNGVELGKSVSDKHIDLLRPSARYYTASKGQTTDAADEEKGKYTLIRDPGDFQGIYDKPLPCFGCGIGWFSDPRERAGLAAAAIAAMVFSVVLMVIAAYFSLF
ncbi:hypothetical protein POTOM_023432 [Populus tomentosa]|uniref:Uncharacterized protein n=1 Tax=Populus tomentosa TaxID=118781 RepID=A0A8X7ZM94_POPTO|nr:hypothetical protein POTOM_023432 [Populus tomentosa]